MSKLCAFGRILIVDTPACDGRKPRTPQNEAGILTPPIVSVPEKSIKGIYQTSFAKQPF